MRALCVVLLAVAAPLFATEKWVQQYAFGENNSDLTLTDLKFPSPRRGVACGVISTHSDNLLFGNRDKEQPVVLITNDGGATWTRVTTKEAGLRLFFVDDSTGWMITASGVWRTEESGRTWKRTATLKNIRDLYFFDRRHGIAVGAEKQALETRDGGTTWKPIEEADKPQTTREWTVYSSVAFAGPLGIIAGWSRRPNPADFRRDTLDLSTTPRETPRMTLIVDSHDSATTWHGMAASIMGQVSRLSLAPSGFGLALFEFHGKFPWPSEVYRIELANGRSRSTFRVANRAITDVLAAADGDSYLAGIQPATAAQPSPLPGKVKILRSATGSEPWTDMPVDYRAVAHRVFLASAGGKDVWAGLDSGVILKLTDIK